MKRDHWSRFATRSSSTYPEDRRPDEACRAGDSANRAKANIETNRRALEHVDGVFKLARPPRWKRNPAFPA